MAGMSDLVTRLHYELVHGVLATHGCPTNSELVGRLGVDTAAVEDLLRRLSDIHGVVLHPHVCEPWILHPFSLTPTIHWVEGARGGWWAPCVWCAFGVAGLAGGEVRIHTRIAAESETVVIPVRDGRPEVREPLWAHFAIRPARAWQNVHQHCAMVLPFRSPDSIDEWCARYRMPCGQVVPLDQVATLARLWYGRHADPDWHKWSVDEAQQIFHAAGLTDPFWDLGAKKGAF
jgi:hypothetical protein